MRPRRDARTSPSSVFTSTGRSRSACMQSRSVCHIDPNPIKKVIIKRNPVKKLKMVRQIQIDILALPPPGHQIINKLQISQIRYHFDYLNRLLVITHSILASEIILQQ